MSSWMPVQLMANGQCGCMSSMLRGTSPVCWDVSVSSDSRESCSSNLSLTCIIDLIERRPRPICRRFFGHVLCVLHMRAARRRPENGRRRTTCCALH